MPNSHRSPISEKRAVDKMRTASAIEADSATLCISDYLPKISCLPSRLDNA